MSTTRTDLPTGTVTFLRTDVEGSMRLARALGHGWDELNRVQLATIRRAIDDHRGVCVRTEGDAVFAVFPEALGAVAAAIDLQRGLAAQPWPPDAAVRARVALHSGEAHLAGDDYGGFDVSRAARIAGVGHGGQIVLSDATRALVAQDLPTGVSVRDLGHHVLRDVPQTEHLFQLDAPGLATDFPPIRTGATTRGNLPVRLTSLIGRETELDELSALLDRCRLLSITGPGGIGKTSLAVELGHRRAHDFPDGAWLVRLDETDEPDQVPTLIARTLGLYDGPGRQAAEGVARHLADRSALVILDNFEHVLAVAPAVSALVQAAPTTRFVVTSRAPLRVAGEQEYPVSPLRAGPGGEAEDGDQPPARRLFVERAASVRPGWTAGPDTVRTVDEICRLVDGLPLAIELAAARVALLPLGALRDRLAARLPLPGGGRRDAPDRQRTIEGAIAWSHDLLSEPQQRLLRELAVFEGGFDLEQVREVATPQGAFDLLDAVLELADHSLVAPAGDDGAANPHATVRFRMLETVRAFGLRRLAEAGAVREVRRRHAMAFLDLAERAARDIPSSRQAPWLDRLAQDHANLRAAIEWSIEAGSTETAQRLAAAMWRYWQLGGHLREGRTLAEAVLAMPNADEPSPARLWALAGAGGVAYWQGDSRRAHEVYLAQLEAARQIGSVAGEADAHFNLSATSFIIGDSATSERELDAARRLYEALGDERALVRTVWSRSNILAAAGRLDEAAALIEGVLPRFRELDDPMYQALSAGQLGWARALQGDIAGGFRYGLESLLMNHALRDISTTTITLPAAAMMLLSLGRPEQAATLMGAYERLSEVHGVRPPAGLGMMIESLQLQVRALEALTAEAYREATERGRQMSLDGAVAFVVEVAAVFEQGVASGGSGGSGGSG